MNHHSRTPLRVRHPLRLRRIHVADVIPLSHGMQRIVFTGEDLRDFATAAADDHVKLFFPQPGTTTLTLPDLNADHPSPNVIARDYTPRRFDPDTRELTIDFVLHETGPATRWAAKARPGQTLGMGGPKGSHIVPDNYAHYLLIGDDSALPAIARRLAEMAPGTPATVIVETARANEDYPLHTCAQAVIHRCRRDQAAGESHELDRLLRRVALPSTDTHAWIAGEIDTARRLRDHLVTEEAIPRAQIHAAGYWRLNTAGGGARIN